MAVTIPSTIVRMFFSFFSMYRTTQYGETAQLRATKSTVEPKETFHSQKV